MLGKVFPALSPPPLLLLLRYGATASKRTHTHPRALNDPDRPVPTPNRTVGDAVAEWTRRRTSGTLVVLTDRLDSAAGSWAPEKCWVGDGGESHCCAARGTCHGGSCSKWIFVEPSVFYSRRVLFVEFFPTPPPNDQRPPTIHTHPSMSLKPEFLPCA